MSAFAEFYRQRNTLTDKYFEKIDEAQKNRKKEFMAAIRIQLTWKSYQLKRKRAMRNEKAIIIQRNFRRHQAQVLVQCLRKLEVNEFYTLINKLKKFKDAGVGLTVVVIYLIITSKSNIYSK